MAYFQPVLHSAQFCLSAYSLFHAYISITNLQQYEEKSEKAAKYSSTAAHDLHKTRTTQTSGTLAVRLHPNIRSKKKTIELANDLYYLF
jgi:hypothetical protein